MQNETVAVVVVASAPSVLPSAVSDESVQNKDAPSPETSSISPHDHNKEHDLTNPVLLASTSADSPE